MTDDIVRFVFLCLINIFSFCLLTSVRFSGACACVCMCVFLWILHVYHCINNKSKNVRHYCWVNEHLRTYKLLFGFVQDNNHKNLHKTKKKHTYLALSLSPMNIFVWHSDKRITENKEKSPLTHGIDLHCFFIC